MTEVGANPENKWSRIGRYLAVALTLAIIVAVFWQFRPGPKPGDDQDLPDGPMGGKIPVSLEQTGDDSWNLQAGPAMLMIVGKPASTFNFRMRSWGMMDDDTRMLIGALRTLQRFPDAVQQAGVSDEQMSRLNDIQPPRMAVADDDRRHVEKLWHDYENADDRTKRDAQQAVMDGMRELTEKSIEPTKQAWTDAGKQLQQTLTLEQLAKVAVYMQNNGVPMGPGGGFRGDGGFRGGGGFRGDGGFRRERDNGGNDGAGMR
jgi:hypothetical protein